MQERRAQAVTADLASAVGSLIDGMIIRQRVDPVAGRSELFGDLVLALIPTMTQPADAPTTEFVDFLTGQLGSRSAQDLLSTAELRARAVQLVIQWVRAGRPRSSITNEAIAAGVDFPVDLIEAALGSPELLVATEIRQYAEMVVLRRPGPADYAGDGWSRTRSSTLEVGRGTSSSGGEAQRRGLPADIDVTVRGHA